MVTLRQVSALPCHRCLARCQSALHSAPPGGACWLGSRCGSFAAVARRRYPGADPRPWEPPAGTPAPVLSPPAPSPADKDAAAAAAARWEHCSWSACSYQGRPTPSSSQDWLRAWYNKEMMDRKHKQVNSKRSFFQGEQEGRMESF